MITIDKKIVGCEVKQDAEKATPNIDIMNEGIKRTEKLNGTTYKIKPPQADHALYVTINDMVLNAGTEHEECHPFEIFLNSKDADHTQWTTALTRIISAVFRKGGDVKFLADELKCVHDPRGGHFNRSRYIPSLVAEIGYVLEMHLKRDSEPEAKEKAIDHSDGEFPATATLCGQCSTKAVVLLDGCQTCLSCGFSKCG